MYRARSINQHATLQLAMQMSSFTFRDNEGHVHGLVTDTTPWKRIQHVSFSWNFKKDQPSKYFAAQVYIISGTLSDNLPNNSVEIINV